MATYDIRPDRIQKKKRGAYDLEDIFLWYLAFIKQDLSLKWIRRTCRPGDRPVFISDRQDCSLVQIDPPRIELFNEKQNYAELCSGETWMPRTVVLWLDRPTKNGQLTATSEVKLKNFLGRSPQFNLLFLKKAGPGIGGGFDVTPIVPSGDIVSRVEHEMQLQNEESRYARDVFILQEGVANPLLTPLGQKLDFRFYFLAVGDASGNVALYASRYATVRNVWQKPYNPSAEDKGQHVTNVTQNLKECGGDYKAITRTCQLINRTEIDRTMLEQLIRIGQDLGRIYGPLFASDNLPFASLLGIDCVVSAPPDPRMYVVELNRRPTVYEPQRAVDMEYASINIMNDVYRLGISSLVTGTLRIHPRPGNFILVYKSHR